ncbi:unnamed protein product [Phytophthora lilii]|uniref:Unnamed protein product n=1 Tax=Phytophthora lilii TaxID=2077276 RepID=A0A9W6X344_9STRA|nr:unnamed protein product [Phytophthora lilii]
MLWEWLVMPQGLKNAPATFNRMVSHVLRPLRDFAPSYFDDIFVRSRTEDGLSAVGNNLHKYTKNYAGLIHPLSSLLKKDVAWSWRTEHQKAVEAVKQSLSSAPVLMLPDPSKPFHVVCDASDFAIGCALMQFDDEGHERVVSYQSRQKKPAEKNYPVHDKELLAMRYALIKFRVYLLGEETFAVSTDHASLRTAMRSPHLSQRMARWLSFFSEYNFVVHYKPGKK